MTQKTKVFCIGFHKTGTSSFTVAMRKLGYRVTGPNGVDDPHIADHALEMALEKAKHFDAFQDNPWPLLYKELDQSFPESKFILTIRDTRSWINSQVKHFSTKTTPMRKWIYGRGCPEGNEQIYIERFNKHNKEVIEYFKERPKDLLIMDLTKGDGWNKLCPFLGLRVPELPFPNVNKSSERKQFTLSNIKRYTKKVLNHIKPQIV